MLRGGVGEGDGRSVGRSLNERERKKKDGNRGNAAEAACGAGGMTESGVAPLRDAAAGKSEVTVAVAVVGRRNDAGGEVHQKPDFN